MLSDNDMSATIPASDLARAKAYYSEKLGLEPSREVEFGGGYFYSTGNSEFLLYPSAYAGTNQATAASWRVGDIDAAVADLKSRGVVFEEYDFDEFKTVNSIAQTPDGSRGAWFKDSEGNILSVFQEA